MTAMRPIGERNGGMEDQLYPGDTLLLGEQLAPGALTTAGDGTITAAMIASGIITRTGPGGAYTDTTDTAANIITALLGNSPALDAVQGSTFRALFINTVAQAMTLAAGTGVTLDTTNGSGVVDCAASKVREWLITINNANPSVALQANTTNGSAVVTFVLPPGRSALTIGPNSPYIVTPGMAVTGTGIAAATKVIGVTQGQGGMTGVTLSANATATSAAGGVALTFGPSVTITGLRSSTL